MSATNLSAAPPAVGAEHRLAITDLAFGGEGVGRIGEFVVFVPFVVPGEEVLVQITDVKRRFARARLLQVCRPSPDRVTPRCRYFGECGGCQYQHLAYERQVAVKQRQVTELLARVGGLNTVTVEPMRPCPQPYGYRNRVMLRTQWDKTCGRLHLGFLRQDSRLVVDVEECAIADPGLAQPLREARAHPPPRGGLKVLLRVLPEGWEVPWDSFFQNNAVLLPELVRVVRECLGAGPARHLVDVYCGVGFFGIELADLVDSFVGIEVDPRAIQAARANAAARGLTNGEFQAGRVEEALPALLRRSPPAATAVILDPPRTGCPPATLELLRAEGPAQLLYVSCHPATLARDLNVLSQGQVYKPLRVVPLDMFPQTQHVECVADLRRPDSPPPAAVAGAGEPRPALPTARA